MDQSGIGFQSKNGLVHSDYYYQAGSSPTIDKSNNNNSNDNDNNDNDIHWQFTDFGHVGEYSRDGSVHATDEVFNSASHLCALMLSFLGAVLLITQSSSMGEPWKIVAFAIYGSSLLFLFGASTLHHSIVGSMEPFLKMLDYLAIFPLIAGTFTPLCLVFFHDNTIGWTFFGTIWFLSICGMILTACLHERIPKWLSMTLYVTMGWLGACMTYWLAPFLGVQGLALLVIGGLWFTVGGYIFYTEQPNPIPGKFGFHEIWHVMVILGALTHWVLMYFYVLPYEASTEN